MKINPIFLVSFLLIINVVFVLTGCQIDDSSRYMWVNSKEHAIAEETNRLFNKYIIGILYLGMPEKDFVKEFSYPRNNEPDYPYITETAQHQYVLLEFPRYDKKQKGRLTFKNQKLVKYERYGLGNYPWGYTDCTMYLRQQKQNSE